jgi:hypothetical protein
MAFPHDGRKIPKGQSGNPKGRPKKIPELRELLANVLGDEKDGKSAAEAILMALRNKAIKGDVRAAELLLDRAYGKVKQEVEANPQELKITISGIEPPKIES